MRTISPEQLYDVMNLLHDSTARTDYEVRREAFRQLAKIIAAAGGEHFILFEDAMNQEPANVDIHESPQRNQRKR